MRKILTAAICLLAVITLAACDKTAQTAEPDTTEETAAATEAEKLVALIDGETLENNGKTLTARNINGTPSLVFTDENGRVKILDLSECETTYYRDGDYMEFDWQTEDEYDLAPFVDVYYEKEALHSVSAFWVCDQTKDDYFDYDGVYRLPSHEVDGTEAYPWELGENLKAYVVNGTLFTEGEGAIPDYAKASDAPWYDKTAEAAMIFVGSGVTRIGDRAFERFGREVEESVAVFLSPGDLVEIGESAFEGTNLEYTVTIPASVETIESRAFANTGCEELYFDDAPETIAEDAFAGCKALVSTVHDFFPEQMKQNYGGELTYRSLYRFITNDIVVGEDGKADEDFGGSGTMYLPENEPFDYSIEDSYNEEYPFSHYEIVKGSLPEGNDPESTNISIVPTEDVEINVYYEK